MKGRFPIFAAALLLVVSVVSSPALAAHKPRAGDSVKDFSFVDFSGRQHRLSDFSGKFVLLDFWATWCQPCLKEIPDLKRARAQFQSRGLVILGMNSDRKIEAARRFVIENNLPWLQSSPASTKYIVHHVLKVKWYPALVLLDPTRRILAVSAGMVPPLYGPVLLKTLNQTLPSGIPNNP